MTFIPFYLNRDGCFECNSFHIRNNVIAEYRLISKVGLFLVRFSKQWQQFPWIAKPDAICETFIYAIAF